MLENTNILSALSQGALVHFSETKALSESYETSMFVVIGDAMFHAECSMPSYNPVDCFSGL
jgi:hypothetical protein